jgi:outer membrane lipoprotein-sorting protein
MVLDLMLILLFSLSNPFIGIKTVKTNFVQWSEDGVDTLRGRIYIRQPNGLRIDVLSPEKYTIICMRDSIFYVFETDTQATQGTNPLNFILDTTFYHLQKEDECFSVTPEDTSEFKKATLYVNGESDRIPMIKKVVIDGFLFIEFKNVKYNGEIPEGLFIIK